ncbi:precorrin-2/cobalt-factor-2 C20-methyltransferase [Rhodovulum imhoffii]|uniref:Precorrin-2/cobalt-factor-2 C20-methyltransferase n=1 Tax=Rhodovulum imhoffii TaxID=365340 RepID=A0A2T5BRD7_9RHOB|nr:precorrin-2 C(20)-methyltransferase [Rhodovulum imhoffii]MBK5934470.1 precorrin-2 C(20)-methyltransferase [Rhodovulum imhoffii]PTN01818.1 precorrin-2/cobalt-factor-2 C20-methyltransferase [Rhodovulum imhoffii]
MGTIHGLGLGPGDPDLMSLRAARLLGQARHVAYFRKAGREGQARRIVEGLIPGEAAEIPMEYPVTTEIPFDDPQYNKVLSAFYADCSARLRALAEAGEDVVVLCEGDPFFYGSFMHLYTRLHGAVRVEVVPGITGMSAAWTATGQPVTWGDDVLSVLPATLPEEALARGIAGADALVFMKITAHLNKLRRVLEAAGRLEDAWLVQNAAMPEQAVLPLRNFPGNKTPYFSIVVVHGQGRRP